MSEPRVIRADYSNWRPVAGRKVLQLILEVPIEQTADVMEKLGFPLPGESKWVAVALLDENVPVAQRIEHPVPNREVESSSLSGATKERKPFASLPLSQQAAIRCQDDDFCRFMDSRRGIALNNIKGQPDYDFCAALVRSHCGVTSRSNIKGYLASGVLWEQLEADFQDWLTTQRYASVAR